jgi:catechol 2,3-dioxygenase-like lactoylglutathione lyase family enzyme
MIKGIHHAQITIPKSKEDEAKKFYCEVLRLNEVEKPNSLKGREGFWVQVGDKELHIGTEENIDRNNTKAHIAYEVSDLCEMEKILNDYGIERIESIAIPGYERFEFRDPFGNRVEFIKPN